MKRIILPIGMPIGVLLGMLAGCNNDSFSGTAVRVNLTYADSLGLDGVEVTVDNKTQNAAIASELFLTLPDALAGKSLPIMVWGDVAGHHSVFGSADAMPKRNAVADVSIELKACVPGCDGDVLTSCVVPPGKCPAACVPGDADAIAHCMGTTPSNNVPSLLAIGLTGMTEIAQPTVINTDTGAITGGVNRGAVLAVDADTGIGYYRLDAVAGKDGVPLAVFAFNNLAVTPDGSLTFTGSRAPVLLIADTGKIDGKIDLNADITTPGTGGFAGGTDAQAGRGCGPGSPGQRNPPHDSGGGGAGGGSAGAPGGQALTAAAALGGPMCLPEQLEPLQGGSGGGRGSPGNVAASSPRGGAGGGAIQITALHQLTVTGTIAASGGGGEAAVTTLADAASGGGGGGGGGILIEAPAIMVTTTATVVVNGGGGGGGGGSGTATPGQNGGSIMFVPSGGTGGDSTNSNNGGTGGGLGPPDVGVDSPTDTGGGGGSFGLIVVRGAPQTRDVAQNRFGSRLVQLDLKP